MTNRIFDKYEFFIKIVLSLIISSSSMLFAAEICERGACNAYSEPMVNNGYKDVTVSQFLTDYNRMLNEDDIVTFPGGCYLTMRGSGHVDGTIVGNYLEVTGYQNDGQQISTEESCGIDEIIDLPGGGGKLILKSEYILIVYLMMKIYVTGKMSALVYLMQKLWLVQITVE